MTSIIIHTQARSVYPCCGYPHLNHLIYYPLRYRPLLLRWIWRTFLRLPRVHILQTGLLTRVKNLQSGPNLLVILVDPKVLYPGRTDAQSRILI